MYGKIAEIQRVPSVARPVSNIQYTYDAAGNRIGKRVERQGSSTIEYTWYVRDASGNVMAVYNSKGTGNISNSAYSLLLGEQHLYGSSRLGILNRNISVKKVDDDAGIFNFTKGNKFFELSNHLGNVLATISDKKVQVDDGTYAHNSSTGLLEKVSNTLDGVLDYYNADVVTANDYYPFGMVMPGRKHLQVGKSYRYGFNSQECSTELNENITSAEYWMYDSRLGRRWNVDPITKEYESPYAALGNNPIVNIDPDGSDTLKFLNNDQALDAMKIASKTLKGASDKKQKVVTQGTSKAASTLTTEIKGALFDAASAYAEKNNLGLGADAEFNNLVQEYAEALRQGYRNSGSVFLGQVAKYLDTCGNSKTSSTVVLKRINAYVNNEENDYIKKYNATRTIFVQLTSLSLSYGSSSIGAGPKGVNPRIPFVPSSSAPQVAYNGDMSFVYRGANGISPLFQLKGGEYKYTTQTVRGLSIHVDAPMLTNARGAAYKITDMPTGLKIIQQGKDAGHFEIVPTSQISQEEFQTLLNQIKYVKQ